MSKSNVAATNRKAFRDYEILESWECGIELRGSEVKSLREGRVNLGDGFARIDQGQVWLYNTHITPYAQASYLNTEAVRVRRLLLHKGQIKKLTIQLTQKGLTLIPLKMYFNDRGFAKIEIALCKGKKTYDKREDVKRREQNLSMRRMMKNIRK